MKQKNNSRSGFAPFIIAIVIALVVVLVGGGYMMYKNRSQPQLTGSNTQQVIQNQNSA